MRLVIAEKPSVAKSIADVLGADNRQDGYFEGYTENYCRVKVKSKSIKTGEILSVKITDREKDVLIAQIY